MLETKERQCVSAHLKAGKRTVRQEEFPLSLFVLLGASTDWMRLISIGRPIYSFKCWFHPGTLSLIHPDMFDPVSEHLIADSSWNKIKYHSAQITQWSPFPSVDLNFWELRDSSVIWCNLFPNLVFTICISSPTPFLLFNWHQCSWMTLIFVYVCLTRYTLQGEFHENMPLAIATCTINCLILPSKWTCAHSLNTIIGKQ